MQGNVIDFNESKKRILDRIVSPVVPATSDIQADSTKKALEKFCNVLYAYQDTLKNDGQEITIADVLASFNEFFDEAYIEFSAMYNLDRVTKFKEAMDYAMLNGGKRIRPFLLFMTYYFCLGDDYRLLVPMILAIECIHTFSLIHDDLPCMDNDELRRGKPTVWKKYGEDIAVLTGDALLLESSTLIMIMLLGNLSTDLSPYIASSALILFNFSGLNGMMTGQVYDVLNTGNLNLSLQDIQYMYEKKTTALLTASMAIGANLSTKFRKNISDIEKLGSIIGESYQIKDDLLEIESTTEKIGKSVNSDEKNRKVTYVRKVGVEKSKEHLNELYDDAMKLIDALTDEDNAAESKVYREVIKYILNREK